MKKLHLKKNEGPALSLSKGFTLLETLIAIFIMVVAFTSLLSLMTTSMFSARYANNEITATYLAQEAVDYIRNDRDTTAFQGADWTGFLAHYGNPLSTPGTICYDSSGGCALDVTDPTYSTIISCPSSCSNFHYEANPTSGGYYINTPSSTSVPTKFKRTVRMETQGVVNPDDEVLITVTVEWHNGLKPRSQTLKASLLKWQ